MPTINNQPPFATGYGRAKQSTIKGGLSILELVVAVAVITIFLSAIVFSFNSFLKLSSYNIKRVKAIYLAEETIEAVRFLKTADWESNIAPLNSGQDYFLNFTGATWQIVSAGNMIGEFERKFMLQDVLRDVAGRIVEQGGNLDSETKKLTASVSWLSSNATTTKSVVTYIAKI